ncbi:MAG: sialidase family protein, partial [Acidimicrobiales bacterium]
MTRHSVTRTGIAALAASLFVAVAPLPTANAQVAGVAPLRTSGNTRLGTDPGATRGADAVGLAIDPSNSNHVAETNVDIVRGNCTYNVTFDGGATWSGGIFRNPDGFPQADSQFPAPMCNAGSSMDGGVAFGSGQNVFAAWSSRRDPNNGDSMIVARSTDGGRTYGTGAVALNNPSAGTPSYQTPEVVVQRGAGAGGADRVYISTRASGQPAPATTRMILTRSDDGGLTWSAPLDASGATEGSVSEPSAPVVAANGTLYVAGRTATFEGFIIVARSTDQGATWTLTRAAPVRGYDDGTSQFASSSFPRLDIDPRNGTVYGTYMQGPAPAGRLDHFIHPDVDAIVIRSTDGITWSAPKRINDDPVGSGAPNNGPAQRQPNINVAPNGRVDVVWQDRRHAYRPPTHSHVGDGEARMGDTYYSYSTDGGVNFSPNRRISDRTQNLDVGYDHQGSVYWNFSPALVAVGNDKVMFAWMDSREGNLDNESQDIYLATLDVNGATGPIPVRRLPSADAADLSVAVSRLGYQGGPEAVLNAGFANRPATRVVIVNASDGPAAMVGAVLARAHLGPVLAAPGG